MYDNIKVTPQLDMDKHRILQDFFGHSQFREGQENIINSILMKKDVLGIMPTGAGKSICYQVPALMLEGITIVVSPLISLMKDQVNALIQSGVRAAYLNSSLSSEQYEAAVSEAKKGSYKIIYVAPERLCTQGFLSIARYVKISMVTVDEAHCVSQWGQDFRPSYMKIPEFLSRLSYRPVVSAFTATATAQVRDDIVKMLGLDNPFCLTTGFDRKNLYFGVLHPKDKYSEVRRLVSQNRERCGIVYCSTRKNVEMVCEKLNADGFSATRYHAGLSDDERRKNQDDFIFDRCNVIVATNAFGMGIDKSNVGYVIHYNMPKNIESYYQEAGRAGRDGENAQCVLLYSSQDVRTNIFLIENSSDSSGLDEQTQAVLKQRDMEKLRLMEGFCQTNDCLREYILRYFGETPDSYCGNCSSCNTNFEEKDITIEAQKILSCIYRLHQRNLRFGPAMLSQILQGANNEKIKQFKLDTLSTYAIMKGTTQIKIRTITKFLESQGYITSVSGGGGTYQVLVLTKKSAEVLVEKKTVKMKMAKEVADNDIRNENKQYIYDIDTELFNRLREVRAQIAREITMPAYIIFTDSALRDMCVQLPQTASELLNCSGVGKVKQQRYGKPFLDAIKRYLRENPDKAAGNKPKPNVNYLDIMFAKKGSGNGGKKLLEMIKTRCDELDSEDEELTLTQLCDDILSQLGIAADKKIVKDALSKWLVKENYLSQTVENGRHFYGLTILSEEAGIIEKEKTSQLGMKYKSILFPKQAQDFIYENAQEIFE